MKRCLRKIFGLFVVCFLMFVLLQTAAAADIFHTTERVNFRTGPSLDSDIMRTLTPGTSVEVLRYDPEGFSRASINGVVGYVFSEYISQSTIFTTTDRVRFRAGPSLEARIIRTLDPDTSVHVLEYDPAYWSRVRIGETIGYIFSEHIARGGQEITSTSSDAPPTLRTSTRVNFRTGPSLDADVIRLINTGTTVQTLNFNPAGWSRVSHNGTVGYIRSDFLVRADSAGVELLEWAVVRTLITRNTPIRVVDVRTGITYTIKCFSIGNHADVEPLARQDTDAIRRTYGGTWSWTPRPVWVTINGRTIAAAINGMPHGGSTISGNGMNGHLCLHFFGSRTHNGNTSYERTLQNAVMEAWRAG